MDAHRARKVGLFVAIILIVFLALGWDMRSPTLAVGIHTLHPDDAELAQIHDLGSQYVIQLFSWREIEPSPGEFHWEYTDWLVRAAEFYHLRVIARLDETPAWAGAPNAFNAVPYDFDTYGDFAGRVAARYRGRITSYIVWNEPNIAREWGDAQPNPAAFAQLLQVASARVRGSDPSALVALAGLAPTNEHSASAMDDRDFLRAVYAAGARDAFDLVAAHPYAFTNPPDDPRGAHDGLNFYRLKDWRDIMIANGDAGKSIWITEFGYTTNPPSSGANLKVSDADQANWIPRAFELAREQMPFVGMFGVWNIGRQAPPSNEAAGYSLIRNDGSMKPAYASAQAMKKGPVVASTAGSISSFLSPTPARAEFQILARDAIVHLGDSEYPTPWVPLYDTKNPSIDWTGEFYLNGEDMQRADRWLLTLETMQVNDFDNRILVNDQAVEPPYLPTEDFTSIWVTSRMVVLRNQLHMGRNSVTVRIGKLFPAFQQLGLTWDDIQIRNVILRAAR